jgi:membrane protease subunit (stomatin/prohibitin family)
MSQQIIAKDLPNWLITIIKKIKFDQLNFVIKTAIKAYLDQLPKKQDAYDITMIETSVPGEFLNHFNTVNYKQISTAKQKELQSFLTDYVKQNKLI